MEEIIIHTDGGSRGNPGPAASAFTIQEDGKIIFEGSLFLGKTTNNIAEYTAVLLALEWLEKNFISSINLVSSVNFILDSELVVKQINGLYKVKDTNLKKLYFEILEKIKLLNVKVNFQNVPRNQNKRADTLVNKELDRH